MYKNGTYNAIPKGIRYTFDVEYRRVDSNTPSAYMGTLDAETLGTAIAEALPKAQYYVDLEPGMRVTLYVKRECLDCYNEGKVTTQKIWHGRLIVKSHRCPTCQGHVPTECECIPLSGETVPLL